MYVEPSPAAAQLTHLQSTAPVSIGVTEHHFLVLRPGQLQMLSNLSGALVQEAPLKSSVDGVALALVKDPFRSALWLITTTSIFQVCILHCTTLFHHTTLQLSYEELKHVIEGYGLEFLSESWHECPYTRCASSMMWTTYR